MAPIESLGGQGRGAGLICRLGLVMAIHLGLPLASAADDTFSRQDPAPAREEAPEDAPRSAEPAPDVALDDLLKLPNTMSFGNERRAGGSADEWRRRFREGRDAIREATDALDETKRALDEMAEGGGGGGQWQVAPPGSNQTELQPMSFKLREEVKRNRARQSEAKKRFRALEIEADLAGVPPEWRGDG